MDSLNGYRTYIIATAALLTIGANIFGFIDSSIANVLLTALGFGGMITLRSALK